MKKEIKVRIINPEQMSKVFTNAICDLYEELEKKKSRGGK